MGEYSEKLKNFGTGQERKEEAWGRRHVIKGEVGGVDWKLIKMIKETPTLKEQFLGERKRY